MTKTGQRKHSLSLSRPVSGRVYQLMVSRRVESNNPLSHRVCSLEPVFVEHIREVVGGLARCRVLWTTNAERFSSGSLAYVPTKSLTAPTAFSVLSDNPDQWLTTMQRVHESPRALLSEVKAEIKDFGADVALEDVEAVKKIITPCLGNYVVGMYEEIAQKLPKLKRVIRSQLEEAGLEVLSKDLPKLKVRNKRDLKNIGVKPTGVLYDMIDDVSEWDVFDNGSSRDYMSLEDFLKYIETGFDDLYEANIDWIMDTVYDSMKYIADQHDVDLDLDKTDFEPDDEDYDRALTEADKEEFRTAVEEEMNFNPEALFPDVELFYTHEEFVFHPMEDMYRLTAQKLPKLKMSRHGTSDLINIGIDPNKAANKKAAKENKEEFEKLWKKYSKYFDKQTVIDFINEEAVDSSWGSSIWVGVDFTPSELWDAVKAGFRQGEMGATNIKIKGTAYLYADGSENYLRGDKLLEISDKGTDIINGTIKFEE